ncbi:MAG: serine hydrolase domain-containing protein [Rhodanobacteraceae bacterium]
MTTFRLVPRLLGALLSLTLVTGPCWASADQSPGFSARVDRIVGAALAKSGVPSASVGVVRGGKLVYAHAYGSARVDSKTPATPAMRYEIGSISKQFTAAAILLLQRQGKLNLDDKISKFFPDLTDAHAITIRQVLSHTSGYPDYWPQDYLMPSRKLPTTPAHIMAVWARRPLNFSPGTRWQYSNTNYVIAGAIVQKVTGQTPFAFLQQHVFRPLGITDAYDANLYTLPASDAEGYHRYALGPLRPAQAPGANWMFGAGELAMTASDLAKWDIAMIDQALLSPASWEAMQTDVLLNDGLATGYGLGVFVGRLDGHRMISHDGEALGFTAANDVFPDDRDAVVVLTNQDAVTTSDVIARRIAKALLEAHVHGSTKALAQAKAIFAGLQRGSIDRSLFTADANSYFSATALHDYQTSLAPLGSPRSFTLRTAHERGGMKLQVYLLTFTTRKLLAIIYTLPNGKLEQYIVAPAD